jgi:hypothetical protein
MKYSSALLGVLSASFAVAAPLSPGTETAAEWFDKAYSENRSPEHGATTAEWFGKAYTNKCSPEEATEWFDKAYSERRSPEKDAAAAEWFDKAYESN